MAQGGWVYLMTNRPRGVLYTGVAANLAARIYQHRTGTGSDFCAKYNLTKLVHAERADHILDAITREKAIKAWQRAWKIALIEAANPEWRDLYDGLHLAD